VKTNIHGAQNVIDAAIDTGVKKVVALSTIRRSIRSISTRHEIVCEKIIIQGNSYRGARGTLFSCVRYGNVIGSRGSVIPLFRNQKKTGKLTITDLHMTRFWLTLDQAVALVINASNICRAGKYSCRKSPA